MTKLAKKLAEQVQDNAGREVFLEAVIAGLAQEQKTLPTSYLYDARGSELFEEITELDEYYQTRTEVDILNNCAREWAASLQPGTLLVEFGSGSSIKTEILLSQAETIAAYAPIDVSPAALAGAQERLARRFPELEIVPIVGDFQTSTLPRAFARSPHAGFFPGSTIGNWTPDQAKDLLRAFAKILGRGSQLLIGIDLSKDAERLVAAYDDAKGVTAAFNLNLLTRINRELGADFDLSRFQHLARYNTQLQRIEMHLVSLAEQTVTIAGRTFTLVKDETIHTENSYKYTVEKFRLLVSAAGWQPTEVWTDADSLFSVHALIAE